MTRLKPAKTIKLVKKILKNIKFHNIIGKENVIYDFDEALIRAKKLDIKTYYHVENRVTEPIKNPTIK